MISSDWLIVAISFILASGFFLLILALGQKLLKYLKFPLETPAERLVISASLGLIVVFLSLFLLGVAHFLTPLVVGSLVILATVFSFKNIILILSDFKEFLKKFSRPWLLFLIGLVLFLGLAAIAPPHHSEELSYYLTVPKIYAQAKGIIAIENIWQSYIHSHTQLLSTVGFLFTGYPLVKILIVFINSLVPLAIYVFSRRFWGEKVGLVAAIILAAMPLYTLYQDLTVPDVTAVLFIIIAMYFIFLFLFFKSLTKYLVMAGILLGTAISVKLNFAIFVAAVFIVTVIAIFYLKVPLSPKLKGIFYFLFFIFIFSAPWLVWNWLQVGNPFFPFGGSRAGWLVISAVERQPLTIFNLPDLFKIISLPWLISINSYLGVMFLIFLPWLWLKKDKKPETKIIILICLLAFSFYLWLVRDWSSISIFNFNDLARYNLAVWVILSPLVAGVILAFWQSRNFLLRSGLVVVLVIYLGFWAGIQLTARLPKIAWLIRQNQLLTNYENFINTVLPHYPALITQYDQFHPAVHFLNQLPGSDLKILTAEARTFYLEKPFVITHGFPELPTRISYDSPALFIKRLKTLEITHIIVPNYQEWYTKNIIKFFKENQELVNEGILQEVFQWEEGTIYKFEAKG